MIATDFLCHAEGASLRRAVAPHGRHSQRKPRSRSSPVRTGSASPDSRARSPSASPPSRFSPPSVLASLAGDGLPAARAHRTARVAQPYVYPHAQLATLASLEGRHYFARQRADLSYSSAYFSLQPPSLPVRVVKNTAPTVSSAAAALQSPPRASPRPHARASRRVARRLLGELVARVPLLARENCEPEAQPPTPHSACSCSTEAKADKSPSSPISTIKRKARGPAGELEAKGTSTTNAAADACRSVAVQALAARRSTDEDDLYFCHDDYPQEGWVGGVRALRDSHVRLVLKQLRHIERLNRALDRAPRPKPALPAQQKTTQYLNVPQTP